MATPGYLPPHGTSTLSFRGQLRGTPTRTELVGSIRQAETTGFEVVSSADHTSSRLAVMPVLSTAPVPQ